MKRVVHITEYQYIKNKLPPGKKRLTMHNPKTNFLKFFDITKRVFSCKIDYHFNFQSYKRQPKLSDCEILALVLTAESIGIDSENYLFGKLKSDYKDDFPALIDRSNFNRRRKRLAYHIKELNQYLADQLNEGERVYIVDSIPVPVCQLAREKRSKICKETFETAPDKGYSAVQKNYFYGYKLHLVTSQKGVFQSMDMTKASVHDIKYLKDVKCSGLSNVHSSVTKVTYLTLNKLIYSLPVKSNLKHPKETIRKTKNNLNLCLKSPEKE